MGAVATVLQTGPTGLTLTNGGSGYTNGTYTNGTFTGGGGSGATFGYTVAGGVVQSALTILKVGDGYTSAPTPVISAGGGSGFSATATVTTVTVNSGTATGQVVSIARTSAGSGYTDGTYTNGTFTGGGGTGGSFSYTISGGALQATITVTDGGSGYTSAPTCVLSAGSGTGALATATIAVNAHVGVPRADRYHISVSATNYVTGSIAAANYTCTQDYSSNTASITLSPPAGYFCCAACRVAPLKATFAITDPFGNTFTAGAGSGGGTFGFHSYSTTGVKVVGGACDSVLSSFDSPFRFDFDCGGTAIVLRVAWLTCALGGTNYLSDGGSYGTPLTSSQTMDDAHCRPLALSFTMNFAGGPPAAVFGSGAVTFTATEAP